MLYWGANANFASRVYEEVVNSNPYADSDEQASPATSIGTPGHTALPEPSPTSIFTQSIHSKSREELGPGVEFWSLPPDDAIRSLIPKRLNVPIKEGHDHLPKVETSEISKRILSRVASFDYIETRKKKSQSGGTLESIREVDAPVLDETSPQIEGTHKKLFGKNGWLEGPRDVNRALSTKHNSNSLRELGKRIKQQLAELVSAYLTSLFKGYIPFLTFFFADRRRDEDDPFFLHQDDPRDNRAYHSRPYCPVEAVLRAGMHDLQHRQQLPHAAVLRRSHILGVDQKDQ